MIGAAGGRLLRRSAVAGVLAAVGLAVGAGEKAGTGTISRGPYLQFATHDSIHVVWRTVGGTQPVVRYGKSPSELNRKVEGSEIVVRVSPDQKPSDDLPKLHSAAKNTFQYEARLSGLSPDTTYYYAIYDGDRKLAGGDRDHRLTTHPEVGKSRPLLMWVVGDSGTGGADQKAVYQAMLDFTARHKLKLDMYLHVGDMAYSEGTDEQFQDRFFKIYQPTLRNVVCWPTLGNHEGHTSKGESGVGPYFDGYVVPTKGEAGGAASATEAYYSFDYGRAHFICLDSHDLDRRPSGAMAQWLKADLEKAKGDWLIAFWHHPPYSKGTHDSDKESQLVEMREHLMPILESGGVDLVLTGHSHIYERSMLIDGAYATPTVAEGVVLDDGDGDPRKSADSKDGPYRKSAGLNPHQGDVQVVTGNGGASMGRVGTSPIMKRVFVEFGSTLLKVDGDTLTGLMVNKDGQQRDLFSIVKRGKVTPTRVAKPRLLPEEVVDKKKLDKEPGVKGKPPAGAEALIKPHAEWHYLAGQDPADDWTKSGFHPEGWKVGPAGFGFEDQDDATVLGDMKGKYSAVYLWNEFDVDPVDHGRISEVGLMVNYDDGFIAYLNGQEVARVNVGEGSGKNAKQIESHEAEGYQYVPLKDGAKLLISGDNYLAIEGHNQTLRSSDFTLDPYLVVVKKQAAEGAK